MQSRARLYAVDRSRTLAFMTFQMMFAIITPALISGAVVVGRMRFNAYVALHRACGRLVVYVPLAHWVWGPDGWLAERWARSTSPAARSSTSAPVCRPSIAAIILGPRRRLRNRGDPAGPHNVPFVVLGASLLWFGWFGFNAGSALAADGTRRAHALVTTMLGASAAVVTTWITSSTR